MFTVYPNRLREYVNTIQQEILIRKEACEELQSAANVLSGMASMEEPVKEFNKLIREEERKIADLCRLYSIYMQIIERYEGTERNNINNLEETAQRIVAIINRVIIEILKIPAIIRFIWG